MFCDNALTEELYDLISMGFKYQLLSCLAPTQLLEVTSRHVISCMDIVREDSAVAAVHCASSACISLCHHLNKLCVVLDSFTRTQAMQAALMRMTKMYKALSIGDWWHLRQVLCNFFQDRRVKVSLFLHEGLQTTDGHIVLPSPGAQDTDAHAGDASGTPPSQLGTVRVFNSTGEVINLYKVDLACHSPEHSVTKVHPVPLGGNLYAKDRVVPAIADSGSSESLPPKPEPSEQLQQQQVWLPPRDATKELNVLASMIRPSQADDANTFKLNLFGAGPVAQGSSLGDSSSDTIVIDAAGRRAVDDLARVLNGMSTGDNEGEEDLLALMDSTN
eukprot:jgi/Chlat1/2064/Chrsp17S02537